mmetsp:Transcript_62818/g.118120  ORF Transcript_62818/g.118120 Transcript_62818/m.118120 type:complete len:486 (-) Transcript_62818:118-1575(-)
MPKRGGKRTKKRTHVVDTDETEAAVEAATGGAPVPRSMVLRAPKAKLPHLLQILQQELRKVMAPNTALKLQERKFNTLKDYSHVAGLLKVTHLLLLAPGGKKSALDSGNSGEASVGGDGSGGTVGSRVATVTGAGALLKIGRLPQGPTLTFRIDRYSLMRQVRATQKRSYDVSTIYDDAPLVILNNFGASEAGGAATAAAAGGGAGAVVPPHVKLMRITFQNMFPPLDVTTVRLADCRRVVLFNYDKATESVEQRHFAIRANPVNVSKPIKRILMSSTKQLPDLGKLDDISDWLMGQAGAGDASDSEAEEDHQVVLPQRMRGRGNSSGQTAAVKLSELGPRLTLSLFKVERGLCEGDVMFHALETKTTEEVLKQKHIKAVAESEKRKRREVQEGNVERKRAAEEVKRAAKRARREAREAVLSGEPLIRRGAAEEEDEGEVGEEDDEEEDGEESDEEGESGEDDDDGDEDDENDEDDDEESDEEGE